MDTRGNSMSHYQSSEAQCPFYRGEGQIDIYCEWPQGTVLRASFRNKAEASTHRTKFCRSDWPKCPLARMLWEQYDDPAHLEKYKKVDTYFLGR